MLKKLNMNKKILFVFVIIASIIAIIAASVLIYFSVNNAVSCGADSGVYDGDGNALVPGVVYDLPTELVFANLGADISFHADVKPAIAENKKVTWSVAWESENGWAAGKDLISYLVLTPSENGGNNANIRCVAPFGCSILVSVVSQSNANVSATCRVDYAKRINDISCVWEYGSGANLVLPNNQVETIGAVANNLEFCIFPNVLQTAFSTTRKLVISNSFSTFSKEDVFVAKCELQFPVSGLPVAYADYKIMFLNTSATSVNFNLLENLAPGKEMFLQLFKSDVLTSQDKYIQLQEFLRTVSTTEFAPKVHIEYVGKYSSKTVDYPVRVSLDSIVENVVLTDTEVVL